MIYHFYISEKKNFQRENMLNPSLNDFENFIFKNARFINCRNSECSDWSDIQAF